jgi:type IV secretory pathway VirB10-like protein
LITQHPQHDHPVEENEMRSPIQLLVACAVLLATATVAAQVYKWVDKDGRVQYSDQPPPADAKEIKGAPKRAATPAAAATTAAPATAATSPPAAPGKDAAKDANKAPPGPPKTLADANKQSADRRKAEEDAAKKSANEANLKKQHEQRCASAREQLAQMESGRPILTSQGGEQVVMSDEQRAANSAKARAAIAESCNK